MEKGINIQNSNLNKSLTIGEMEQIKNIPLDMYQISGQDEINAHSFERYIKNKEQGQKTIETANFIDSPDPFSKKIPELSKDQLYPFVANLLKIGTERELMDNFSALIIQTHKVDPEESTKIIEMFTEKISEWITSPDPELVKKAAIIVLYSSKEKQADLRYKIYKKITNEINSGNTETKKKFIEIIKHIPVIEDKQLLITETLHNPDTEIHKMALEMIRFIPEERRNGEVYFFIKQGLESTDIEIKKTSTRMLKYTILGRTNKNLFEKIISNKELGNELIKSSLYDGYEIEEKFSRTEFQKTHAKTILLGKELKNKTIIRYEPSGSFIAWQKLYEDYKLWKENGFDYVPIEPIQSFTKEKNGLIAVYSGVLDLNLAEWGNITDRFNSELTKQKNKIDKILEKEHVNHRHIKEENFCLRFFRKKDEKGETYIDFEKIPRLYLIDFDMATSY